ncbi:integrase catalytic domain-containing protein [Trichonephila clavipes]|nr:integrase catalytic domain-containing protein [Trichonephila clavipes]
MFDSSKPDDDVVNFVSKLKSHMQSVHPKPPWQTSSFYPSRTVGSNTCFLRRDMLRRPLQPYDGLFKVLQRKDKVFFLDINGKWVSVSIDRCKPAFFFLTLRTCNYLKPRMKHLLLWNLMQQLQHLLQWNMIQQLQRLPSHLHVLVAKFIFQLGIVDTGRGMQRPLQLNKTTPKLN